MGNYLSPVKEIIVFILIALIGFAFLISCFKSKGNIHLQVFCLLVIIGLFFSVLTPIYNVPDEKEHFTRSEITSRFILTPEYHGDSEYYLTIQSTLDLYKDNPHISLFDADTGEINYKSAYRNSAFAQNPFYGYIPQAIGIFIAKLCDLDAIYMVILARFFNSIMYAGLVSLAIKKTPILKLPLLAMACIPLTLQQSFSVSIDSIVNGLGILAITYFFYMYKTPNLDLKHLIVFNIICLMMGLCKLPYLALSLLTLAVPMDNFKNRKYFYYSIAFIVCLFIIGVLYYELYASAAYLNSYRSQIMINDNINVKNQINYISGHLGSFLITMAHSLDNLLYTMTSLFSFSFSEFAYTSPFVSTLLMVFVSGIFLFYPIDEKFPFRVRIFIFIVLGLIYIGTHVIQYLTWTPVGLNGVLGIQSRYFLPLFGLAPVVFNLNQSKSNHNINKFTLTLIMGFVGVSVLLIAFNFI